MVFRRIQSFLQGPRRVYALFGLILIFAFILSVSTLTTKPRIWTDEAISIEIAKSFGRDGVLDVSASPATYTGFPELLQSTGYPVTVPLGILFKMFGETFTLARLYMLLWTLLALYAVFCFSRAVSDPELALFSTLLVATFASFYGSGRTVVGEIPGFVLLLSALYFAFERRSFSLGGILLGFAIVAKPSVFLLVLPALFLVLLREPRALLFRVFKLSVGMLPAAFLWFALVPDNALSKAFWLRLVDFYRNPYSSDIAVNIHTNLASFFSSTTLIYFSLLAVILLIARFWVRRKETSFIYDFTLIYSLIAFLYYLRSPGWLRYILIAELLILTLVPHAVFTVLHFFQRRMNMFRNLPLATTSAVCLCVLVLIQGLHLFIAADIYSSDTAIRVAKELDAEYGEKRVLVLGDSTLYSLLRNPKREMIVSMTGLPTVGKNSLLDSMPPDVVVTGKNVFRAGGEKVLSEMYRPPEKLYGYDLFKRIDH